MASNPSSSSPLPASSAASSAASHQHQHQHHDGCCPPPASHLPLEDFVQPAASLYPSFISSSDLPDYNDYSNLQQPSLRNNNAHEDYQGLSALGAHQEVYRSVAVDSHSYGVPSAFHGLANLHLGGVHQQQQHDDESDGPSSVLDSFAAVPQGKRNELSLNPKHEQNIDYHVAASNDDICNPPSTNPPSLPGGYLEPSSHFFLPSGVEPHDAMQLLHDQLRARKVDCSLCPDGWKMRCEAYVECARAEFLVRLFHTAESQCGEYAVEFQRRFGDGMVFRNLYAEVLAAVKAQWKALQGQQQQSPRVPLQPSKAFSPLTCPPLADQPDLKYCRQEQAGVIECLLQMCKTECVDVKANAIMALAELSGKCEYKQAMLDSCAVEQFIQCLGCTYQDVHRCALTGLANLVSCRRNTATCTVWMQNERIKHAMCKLIKSGCPQVVRECARSFAFIASTISEQVKDDQCFRHCVEVLMESPDAQARIDAHKAAVTLGVVEAQV